MSLASTGAGVKNLGIGLAILSAIAGVAYVIINWDKIKQKLDITSDKNAAYQGANAVVQAVTGDSDASVGTALYDALHSSPQWVGVDLNNEAQRAQAERTCRALYRPGSGKVPKAGSICALVLGTEG